MVKTLRRKFITITMISVSAVFLIILSVINIVNYTNVYNNAKVRLDVLVENNGKFPERDNQNMGQNNVPTDVVSVENNNVNQTRSAYQPWNQNTNGQPWNGQNGDNGQNQGGMQPGQGGQNTPGGVPGQGQQQIPTNQNGGLNPYEWQNGSNQQRTNEQQNVAGNTTQQQGTTIDNGQSNTQTDSSNNTSYATNQENTGNMMYKPGGKPNGTFNGTDADKSDRKKTDWLGLADNVINEETPFESRYFSVTLSQDGAYISSNLDNIASVTEEDAISYATTLYTKGSTDGMYEDFAYRRTNVDGNIMYIFLDCKRDLSSFRSFLLISILVMVAGLTLVFLLSYVLSRIVLKPVFESYEKQKRFITDASHELKTPVAIIKANTEVIEMESGESEWTHSITKQANRLTSLTEKMVLLSRMDEGDFNKDFVNINISNLFGEICESYEPIAVKMNKKYDVNIEEGIVIKGDESNLTQMMSLLMDNAFKYSDEEGNINVSLAVSGRNKVLKVRNTVDNISEGSHDELFERFYRRDKSRNSKTGGSGIGLSVVQAIAESHKGTITAKSYDTHSIEFKIVF